MKKLVIGILAHVDAGKTTLSEALLYHCGMLRRMGRVDNKDAFLDTEELEKKRGITIFSKQAVLRYGSMEITLLDTPGHVDFSAEMERALQVLDYAVLLISGADGVQGHTKTLWSLLKKYQIPTFLFFNKMDQPGTDKEELLAECREKLGEGIVDFSSRSTDGFYEEVAVCEEQLLEAFLEKGTVEEDDIIRLIEERKLFPCFFGSALYMNGVAELAEGLEKYTRDRAEVSESFGARVYKISRDKQGNRLTFLKLTGGKLRIRDEICGQAMGEEADKWQEKVTQIRVYSGAKYETVTEADMGGIYAVTGLSYTYPGEGLGAEEEIIQPILEPVLTYKVILPEEVQPAVMLPKLRELAEEEPELHVIWKEELQEIHVSLMGQVQLEILKTMIEERFQVSVDFGAGSIIYKETIANSVEGVGHFEPLRHYAEVQLLLEPGERGSGIQTAVECSEDVLARNWQRLILTHIEEKEHKGVLTGSVITDIKITLLGGRAHLKHTEGGDFRQAVYRGIRQGLMQAESVLLEPWYEFTLEIPEQFIGRAMTDIERMYGKLTVPEYKEETAVLKGQAPVSCLQEYQTEVTAYTKGQGHLTCIPCGYAPCHNAEEIIERIGYDAEADLANPSSSVFCAHGAGFLVPWYEVPDYMHLESSMSESPVLEERVFRKRTEKREEQSIGTEEVDAILDRIAYANRQEKGGSRKWNAARQKRKSNSESTENREAKTMEYGKESKKKETVPQKEYLLVDGYNVIFAWEDLKELAQVNIDSARGKLLDVLCNYQGMRGCEVIAVFDAYRVKGHAEEMLDYHNIHVVFTKEAETADQYIERFSHENGRKYQVTVATSDGLEQIIILGQGCRLLSARELKKEIDYYSQNLRNEHMEGNAGGKHYMLDGLEEKLREQLQ